jgi:hypothetical protein
VTNDQPKGIDIIVLAEKDWYDDHPRLLRPYALSLKEAIAYLNDTDLQYFIPHPTLFGSSLPRLITSDEEMEQFLASVPAFEAVNGCYLLLDYLFSSSLLPRKVRSFGRHLRESAQPDLKRYQREHHRFLAVGSDAHHPRELGFSVEIPGHCPASAQDIFERITSNTDIKTLHFPRFSAVIPRLLSMAWTTFAESQMRREWQREEPQSLPFDESLILQPD